MSLDVSSQQFQQWIQQAGKLVSDFYKEHRDGKIFADKSQTRSKSC
ncbi:hypothetical protein Asal01_03232 [Fodinibius salicampi]